MAVSGIVLGLLAMGFGSTAARLTRADPVVTLTNGSYEGLYLPSFEQDIFLGVPYAQDTGGQNRFRVPQSLNETWSGHGRLRLTATLARTITYRLKNCMV